jgi:pimeloyl-ACP methyl ester carboxylesterase
MSTVATGDVTNYYEAFGYSGQPTLVLINGLGSQCINYAIDWCELFAAEGYQVVRFDNRDVGLSSKLDDKPNYTLADMASDAVAVLDAVGVERANVMGCSMGGMIAQRLAVEHPEQSTRSPCSRPVPLAPAGRATPTSQPCPPSCGGTSQKRPPRRTGPTGRR